ncbi:unnamed protein product, partial [Ectocarpus sp. 4 AP-2014]
QRDGDGAREDLSRAREGIDRGHHEREQALDAVDPQGLLQVEGPAPHQHLPGVSADGSGVRPARTNAAQIPGREGRNGERLFSRREVAMAKCSEEALAVGVD